MFNLIANALKFTPANGEIRLSASKHADEIALVVEDTGIGIDLPKLDKVFEPFERAHSTRAVGAGLGLPLVRSFIELHGGRVEFDSVPGRGTRVICHLPLGAVPIGVASRCV
jgi:signal transduction histidine kinase